MPALPLVDFPPALPFADFVREREPPENASIRGQSPRLFGTEPSEKPFAVSDDQIEVSCAYGFEIPAVAVEHSRPRLSQQNTSASVASVATEASIMGGVMSRISFGRSVTQMMSSLSPGVTPTRTPDDSEASSKVASNKEATVSLNVIIVAFGTVSTMVSCSIMLVLLEHVLDTCASNSRKSITHFRLIGITICSTMTIIDFALGLALGRAVSQRISTLTRFMECLGEANTTNVASDVRPNFSKQLAGCRIRDVRHMHVAFCRLSSAVAAFERYLPETVVRGILRGEERVSRLHVSRRNVTIMFSDIEDFTTIAEGLSQNDLLFLLTRYFSIMSRIVASYGGVVAEILGDGLLVYFNTPDDVVNHASKACSAALAQCQVLPKFNDELRKLELPTIALRIGIHTGRVLTGNIGSESKMKFGCIGDPVNLASRLEGLCKIYGCSIICSGATYDSLPRYDGFCTRELDFVQVKGKQEPVRIYEVVGINSEMSALAQAGQSFASIASEALQSSTEAMQVVNVLAWNPLLSAISGVAKRISSSSRAFDSEGSPRSEDDSPSSPRKTVSMWPEPERLVTEVMLNFVRRYEAALNHYQEGRFGEARDLAEELLTERPGDKSILLLLDRSCRYIGPDDEIVGLSRDELSTWSGVLKMHDK